MTYQGGKNSVFRNGIQHKTPSLQKKVKVKWQVTLPCGATMTMLETAVPRD